MNKKSYYKLHPQIYDDQFWWKKDDIEFWKRIFYSCNKSVLELAAGTGRLALPLVREKINYTGIELSKEYCVHANKKLECFSKDPLITQGDIRCFNFNYKYDIIFIAFNSLCHLISETELIKTLNCIKNHMYQNSKLYIDIFVPHTKMFNNNPKALEIRGEFYDSVYKKNATIKETLNYDYRQETIKVKWFYESKSNIYNTFSFAMKIYYPDTMNRVLIENGFNILNLWGGYEGTEFNESSNLQIYQCTLR